MLQFATLTYITLYRRSFIVASRVYGFVASKIHSKLRKRKHSSHHRKQLHIEIPRTFQIYKLGKIE